MTHAEFLAEVARIDGELGALIERAHTDSPPTVEWVSMLAWAACVRAALSSLVALGIPDDETPIAPGRPS